MERLMPASPAPTHDLIRLREPIALTVDAPVPAWVEPVLRRTPWVVVRRGYVLGGMMPVGVRGLARHERFAAVLAVAEIAAEACLTSRLPNGISQNRATKPAAQSTSAQPSPATTRRISIRSASAIR